MSLQELTNAGKRELDMLGAEAAKLKDHLQEGFAENFSEAKNAAQNGIGHITDAAQQVESDAQKFRARVNEEVREARKYVDERFGGRTLASPKSSPEKAE